MVKKPEIETKPPTTGVAPSATLVGHLTPAQLFAVTALAIFAGEALIMFIMPLFGEIPVGVEAILDATMLTLVAAPFLYFFLFRPIVLHIDERKNAELALLNLNHDLEHRVEERTNELTRSNKALEREVQDRRATEKRLQRTNDFVQRLIESAPCLMATIDASSLKCNYVNGRVEDFLGISPDEVAASGGTVFDSIIASSSRELYRKMILDVTVAPPGEIARGQCHLENSAGEILLFRFGVVVVSRTPLGEAEEVLVVATPVDVCG
jgi:PAS domain-containing protein